MRRRKIQNHVFRVTAQQKFALYQMLQIGNMPDLESPEGIEKPVRERSTCRCQMAFAPSASMTQNPECFLHISQELQMDEGNQMARKPIGRRDPNACVKMMQGSIDIQILISLVGSLPVPVVRRCGFRVFGCVRTKTSEQMNAQPDEHFERLRQGSAKKAAQLIVHAQA